MERHGLLNEALAVNGEEVICPGDYIVTNRKGRFYKLSAEDFETQYEPYESAESKPAYDVVKADK